MGKYYPDIVRFDPMRRLCWRWDRAHVLLERGMRFSKRRDDEWTGRAMRYLRTERRSRRAGIPDAAMATKAEHFDIYQAQRLDADADAFTWIVQARLLAGQSGSEIGPHVLMDAAGVEAYESLFFNVRERLNAKVYTAKMAVGWTSVMAAVGCDLGTVVRWFGYFGGKEVLDIAISVLLPLMAKWDLRLLSSELVKKVLALAVTLMMPQDDWKDQRKLLHLHARLMELTQLAGVSGDMSLGDVFSEIVNTRINELTPECFEPSSTSTTESAEELGTDALCAVREVTDRAAALPSVG